jgi:hypothetical protein
VLSRNDFNIQKLSYDLIYPTVRLQSYYFSEEWDFCTQDSCVWLSYPQFIRSIGKISLINGHEDFFSPESLENITDIDYVSIDRKLYILDGVHRKILVMENGIFFHPAAINVADEFLKIAYSDADNWLYVLGKQSFIKLSAANPANVQSLISFPNSFEGTAFDFVDDLFYVLASSENEGKSNLYTVSLNTGLENIREISGFLYKIRFDGNLNVFYAAEKTASGESQVVQLSPEGSRQFELHGFKLIEQIEINPYNHTFVVVDYSNDLISLFDFEGNFISESKNNAGSKYLYRPLRIFIE